MLLLLAVLAVLPPGAFAKTAQPVPSFTRVVIPLNDGWECAADVDGSADRMTWAQALPDAKTVNLPLAWDHHPLQRSPGAVEWYACSITFPEAMPASGALLVIDNPVGVLDVFLDGKPVATFFGNGLARQLVLHGEAKSVHRLAFRLDRGALPDAMHEASPGLGPVRLELLPPVRIESVVPLIRADENSLVVHYRLSADVQQAGMLYLELFAPGETRPLLRQDFSVELIPGVIEGERKLKVKKLQRWSPEKPAVYRLRATLAAAGGGDVREAACGAVDFSLSGNTLRVNGTTRLLKGLRLPGGVPPLPRATLQRTLETELDYARQAGFNTIMAEGAALPAEVLEIADRLGLLVIGEIPLARTTVGETTVYRPDFNTAVEEMGGHPCLAAWSFAGAETTENTAAILRALDPTRPIIWRNGTLSQWFAPGGAAGKPFVDVDLALRVRGALDMPATPKGLPVLVSKIGATLPANGIGEFGSKEAWETAAYTSIRTAVESIRQPEALLGYFVRPVRNGTLTGLVSSADLPTRAFTSAVVYNQHCLVTLAVDNPGNSPRLQAAVINDQCWSGNYNLYQVKIDPEGTTSVIQKEVTLRGERVLNISDLATLPASPGTYKLQLLLAKDMHVVASTQVVTVEVK